MLGVPCSNVRSLTVMLCYLLSVSICAYDLELLLFYWYNVDVVLIGTDLIAATLSTMKHVI